MVGRPPAEAILASLRRDLEEIDRGIVVLVAARIEAACEAIRVRSEVDGRVANPAQEARVIARAQAWGHRLGLTPELTKTIFQAIMDSGKERFAIVTDRSRPWDSRRGPARVRPRGPVRSLGASTLRPGAPSPT